jgi:hypothetical protein
MRAMRAAPGEDRRNVVGSGQRYRFVQAGQEQIGQPDGGADDGADARQWPQRQPQVGIETDLGAGRARGFNGGKYGVAGAGGNRLRNAGNVQPPGVAHGAQVHRLRLHAAGRRAGAQVAEGVAFRPVVDEIQAGGRLRIACDRAGIHAFRLPQVQQHAAEMVVSDAAQVSGAGALPGCGDHGVGRVAAKALAVNRLAGRALVELHHGLAQRYYVKVFCHLKAAG